MIWNNVALHCVVGGALGQRHAKQIYHIMDDAIEGGMPFVADTDSPVRLEFLSMIREHDQLRPAGHQSSYRREVHSCTRPPADFQLGNLVEGCAGTNRLAVTARTALIDIVTILPGFCPATSTSAQYSLHGQSILILVLGAVSFATGTAVGVSLFSQLARRTPVGGLRTAGHEQPFPGAAVARYPCVSE